MPGYHDAHFQEHAARETVWRVVADHLASHVPPSARVLELGAAYCHWINNVRATRRVAVDIWDGIAQHAAPGVEARVLDLAAGLGEFADGTFDVVLASNLLEHFHPDDAAALAREVFRVLTPSGRFLIVQPNFRYAYRSYFDDYTHRAIFTDVSLPNMLKSVGYTIARVEPRFLPYSMRDTRYPIHPWLVRAYLASPFKPRAGQMLVVATRP
ncbi:MAG: class I SAM-dependent methyltransferase [Acidobacteria bacterium]|nr:class I SAM-dependent methyltransferase [Acidobacteriota bacterium]